MFGIVAIFSLLIVSIRWTKVSCTAPGFVTLTIGIPELLESCGMDECQYAIEFCIGSGRLPDERCSWYSRQRFSGQFFPSKLFLVRQTFEVDNIRSSLYFNANLTIHKVNKVPQIIQFKDNLFKYSSINTIHSISLYSEAYESIPIEMTLICKPGYYPEFQCIRYCLAEPAMYDCDSNGNKICSKGYVLSNDECVKDACRLKSDICLNNSTCESQLNSIRCICQPNYAGTACEKWVPCLAHKCKNSGICVERRFSDNYICQCKRNYYGKFCENYDDPCKLFQCPTDHECQTKYNEPICVNLLDNKFEADGRRWFSKRKTKITTSESLTKNFIEFTFDGSNVKGRETIKLIQYPLQRDYTTIGIIIVLLIFMICSFTIIFWAQLNKYYQKRKKLLIHSVAPQTTSIIPMQTQTFFGDSMKKWRSLDDGFSNTWGHHHRSQFSVMSYKTGFNTYDRSENPNDTYCYRTRNRPTTITTKVSMTNGTHIPGTLGTSGYLNESTQTDLDRVGNCAPIIDCNDLPIPEESLC